MSARVSGFAMVSAIFLLVVLAALGAYMVTLSGTHQATPRQSVLGARVYFGAKAGLEWGIQRAIATSSCVGGAGTAVALAGSGLTGVTATVICTSSGHTGGTVYRITSTAVTGTFGALDYAQRRMEATVSNIP